MARPIPQRCKGLCNRQWTQYLASGKDNGKHRRQFDDNLSQSRDIRKPMTNLLLPQSHSVTEQCLGAWRCGQPETQGLVRCSWRLLNGFGPEHERYCPRIPRRGYLGVHAGVRSPGRVCQCGCARTLDNVRLR